MARTIRGYVAGIILWLTLPLSSPLVYCADPVEQPSLSISDVSLGRDVMNPSTGETVDIRFSLSENAKVSLRLFDFDGGLVTFLAADQEMEKGSHAVSWNGQDQNGVIVPDEAYFPVIEARCGTEAATYDPTAFSGGISHELDRVEIAPERRQVAYSLPEKGRVSVKAGIMNGPLVAIPVDWEPRPRGENQEYWDGMDQDKLFSVLAHPRFKIRVSYYTLPENTIITMGNKAATFRRYQQMRSPPLDVATITWSRPSSILASPLYTTGVLFAKSPPIEVTLPTEVGDKNEFPAFKKDKIPVQVDLPEGWKASSAPKLYEIYFFLDHEFLTEDPQIQFPYQTALAMGEISPGVHLLTINVIGPGGQIGIINRKLILQ